MNEKLMKMLSSNRGVPIPLAMKTALLLKQEKERYEREARLAMEISVREQIFQNIDHGSIASYDPDSVQYCCMSCGDRFYIKSSYKFHLDIKYIKINFFCRLCNAPYIFYNRCKLIAHMSSHVSSTLSFRLSDIEVSPYLDIETDSVLSKMLLSDQLIPQNSDLILSTQSDPTTQNDVNSNLNISFVNSTNDVTNIESNAFPLINNYSESKDLNKVSDMHTDSRLIAVNDLIDANDANDDILELKISKCSECSVTFKSSSIKSDRFLHFSKIQRAYSCKKCALNLPNMCALKSHLRTHFNNSPYVCPDCGAQFAHSLILTFHNTFVCMHLTRKVYTNCIFPSCREAYEFSKIRTHIKLKHLNNRIHKCKLCVFASRVESDVRNHHDFVHALTPYTGTDFYHQCTLCTTFISPLKLYQHVQKHLPTSGCLVYICPGCDTVFRRKSYLQAHQNKCVKYENLLASSKESLKGLDSDLISISESDSNISSEYANNSSLSDLCHNGENLHEVNIANRGCDSRTIRCYICNSIIRIDFQSINLHFSKCHNEIISDIRIVLERLEDACGISTYSKLSNQEIQKSGSDLVIRYDNCSLVDTFQKRTMESSISVNLHSNSKKRRKIKLKKNGTDEINTPFTNGILISQQNGSDEGLFLCAKCVFKTSEKEDFQQHIMKHRDVSTAYQCMECGSSFTVKPSFATHLFISHQINNVEEYIISNDCFDKKAVKQFKKDLTLPIHDRTNLLVEELQCHICLEKFDNQSDFDKHFRVHGMAFLLQKQKK